MIGIIGKKLGMTQIFNEAGQQIPVTVVEAPPNPGVFVNEKERMGYASVQLGYGQQRTRRASKSGERTPRGRRASKAEVGHAAKAGLEAPPAVLRSFRIDDAPGKKPEIPTYKIGDVVKVDIFTPGEKVKVTGTSKGRGFQGVVKRYGFRGGPKTHGQSDRHRAPGSIGSSATPGRVFKGLKMAGHMGDERVTVQNLRILRVDTERNLLLIEGSVPGPNKGLVIVRRAVKARKK
jgi:large subunit ribosomal protein L3